MQICRSIDSMKFPHRKTWSLDSSMALELLLNSKKSCLGKKHSLGDPSCVHVHKINEFYLRLITCVIYSLSIFAIKYWLSFEQEINYPPNVEDGEQPIKCHTSNPGNEWIHMLQFKILHCKWWILIVFFIFQLQRM